MEIFYHLSHFFEFLTSFYFGSFALLGFIQKDASHNLNKKLSDREENAMNARVQVLEFFSFHINTRNGSSKALSYASKWAFWEKSEKYIKKILEKTNYVIADIVTNEGIFIKRFFPVFFYMGCYCLSVILFSGYSEVSNNNICKQAISLFFIYYSLSTVTFQIWGVFIFPFLVGRNDYLKLTVVNIFICIILLSLTEYLSSNNKINPIITFLASDHNKDSFLCFVLILSLVPLFAILIFCGMILVFWFISNIFYYITLRSFNSDIDKDIQDLK